MITITTLKKIPSIVSIILLFFCFSCEKPEPSRVKVSTGYVTFITQTSCIVKGTIIEMGKGSIIQHGHCWSTSENPLTNDSKTQLGSRSSIGSFTSALTGLTANTTYYVKAYAIDGEQINYGNEVSFTTLEVTVPSVKTSFVSNISINSATCGGNVTDDGGAAVTARGVCWSKSQNPNVADNHTIDGSGMGSFASKLTGLTFNTIYYIKAYAINSEGIAYGSQVSFITKPKVRDIDGNTYNVIQIGSQIWMQENLKTTSYKDSTNIPLITDIITWGYLTSPGYCWYNNDEATYKNTYGALYNWYAVTTGKLCPTGWHVPSDTEWKVLTDYLGEDAGGKMKETGTTHWNDPNTGATNETGFTALPCGYRGYDGVFTGIGSLGFWWSSTDYLDIDAWYRRMYYDYSNVYRDYYSKKLGFSVRCLKD